MTAPANTPEAKPEAPDFHTDLPVGEILRRTRVHYNLSLDDVANYLRIRATQLDALEKNDIDQLPGRVYAIGYVRTYSEYLGLDGEKMIQIFKQQATGRVAQKPEYHFPVSASESKAPNMAVIFGSLAVLVLVLGVWIILSAAGGKKDEADDIAAIPNVPSDMRVADVMKQGASAAPAAPAPNPDIPANAQTFSGAPVPGTQPDATAAMPVAPASPAETDDVSDAPATSVAVPDSAEDTPMPTSQTRQIVINVKERSWVEVRDKRGKTILSRILKPGEIFIVPEENYGLRLDTGNAGGLDLIINGQKMQPLGKQGDILRGFVLDGNEIVKTLKPLGTVNQ